MMKKIRKKRIRREIQRLKRQYIQTLFGKKGPGRAAKKEGLAVCLQPWKSGRGCGFCSGCEFSIPRMGRPHTSFISDAIGNFNQISLSLATEPVWKISNALRLLVVIEELDHNLPKVLPGVSKARLHDAFDLSNSCNDRYLFLKRFEKSHAKDGNLDISWLVKSWPKMPATIQRHGVVALAALHLDMTQQDLPKGVPSLLATWAEGEATMPMNVLKGLLARNTNESRFMSDWGAY